MPRLSRSNPLALAVLVSLMEAPMHPYQVAQTLRSRAKEESVRLNYGSLYAVFNYLEKRGLIKARETLRDGRRPERTVYEVTEEGTREAVDWLAEMIAVPVKEYPQFMAALSFMPALPPDDALAALEQRARHVELRLLKCRSVRRATADFGLPRLFCVEGEYEEALLEAEMAFIGELVKALQDGSLEGLQMWRGFHSGDMTALGLARELDERRAAGLVGKEAPAPGN